MAGQKTVQKEKESTKPKKGKKRRPQDEIEKVKKKGDRIARMAGAIIALSSIKWEVSSQTVQDLCYVVRLNTRGLICQCPANAGGKMICKHVFGVYRLLEIEWWKNRRRKKIKIKRRKLRCRHPECASYKVVKNGRRKTKKKGLVQRYKCKMCGRTFSGTIGFVGRHFSEDAIVKALSLVATKMSHEEAADKLAEEDVIVHASTVFRWVRHYSQIMCNYSATLRVDAGCMWHVDEIHLKIMKKARYLFAVMDHSSRFVLSFELSHLKQGVDPTDLFSGAAARTHRLPRIFVSDGLQDFCQAAKKVFYRVAGPRFVHIREVHLQNMFNQNNIYERLNGTFKERLKCIRGLKSEDCGIIRLMIINYNFFRKHTSLKNNMTPAEAIGIDIVPTPGSNIAYKRERWITFIENAAIHNAVAA